MKSEKKIVWFFSLVAILLTAVEIAALKMGFNGKCLATYFGTMGITLGFFTGKFLRFKWMGVEIDEGKINNPSQK